MKSFRKRLSVKFLCLFLPVFVLFTGCEYDESTDQDTAVSSEEGILSSTAAIAKSSVSTAPVAKYATPNIGYFAPWDDFPNLPWYNNYTFYWPCVEATSFTVGNGKYKVMLWKGDYKGFWRTGGEICIYEKKSNGTKMVAVDVQKPIYQWYFKNPGYWRDVYWYSYTEYYYSGSWPWGSWKSRTKKVYRKEYVMPSGWTSRVVGYYTVKEPKMVPIYMWAPNSKVSEMEFRLYKKRSGYSIQDYLNLDKNQIIVSCDRNLSVVSAAIDILTGVDRRTWWIGAHCGRIENQSYLETWDTVMVYRVKEFWGDQWRIWEGAWKSEPSAATVLYWLGNAFNFEQ